MGATCSVDDLVIDIGDVHTVKYVVVEVVRQHATQNVERDVGTGVTHVRCIVHRWSTAVPKHTLAGK